MRRLSATIAASVSLAVAAASTAGATETKRPDDPGKRVIQQSTTDRPERSASDTGHAHDHANHGESEGHLPPVRENVRVVGKAAISGRAPGRVADVGVFREHAYLAAYSDPACQDGGVAVFDIESPRDPRQVDFIPTGPGSYVGEGVHIRHLETRTFTGDVLIFNNEICGTPEAGTVGGATLVDVTNPRRWKYLSRGFGDQTPAGFAGEGIAHQTHSTFIWTDGRRAYAVLVDDEEAADVDIFNITDPRKPRLIAEHNLSELFPEILQEGLDEVFLHDMIVKEVDGRPIMLLSYWDGGYVKLDVSNPREPVLLGDSDFTFPDPELLARTGRERTPEGNAHQAEFTKNNRYVVGTDEDFNPFALEGQTDDGGQFSAVGGSATPPILPDSPLAGTAVYVGRACNDDAAVPAAPTGEGPYIAVAERGVCFFDDKVANIQAAGGYAGVIIFNRTASDGCGPYGGSIAGDLPTATISREAGYGLFDIEGQYDEAECLAGTGEELAPLDIGETGDEVTVAAVFDGWGYIHLFDNRQGRLRELDTFAVPEAMDQRFAGGDFGALSVHEVATSRMHNRLVYVAYYDAGFRVLKIKHNRLKPVGAFVGRRGTDFWGAQVFKHNGAELVAASDRDYGLYILKYTGRPSTSRP